MNPTRNFLLNTDYPIDKIVYLSEGEWTPTGFDAETGQANAGFMLETGILAPHMVGGEWTDDDWETSYPIGSARYTGEWYQRTPTAPIYEKYTNVLGFGYADNEAYISISTAYSKTIKYRAYIFIPESYWDAIVQKTASLSSPLVLDTRNNYPKLVADGIVQLTANTPVTFYHNLGFKPLIRVWQSFATTSLPDATFTANSSSVAKLTETELTFETDVERFVYYRMYADEI